MATKFTESGYVRVRVDCSSTDTMDCIVFQDSGTGISSELHRNSSQLRVLVGEDHLINPKSVIRILRRVGHALQIVNKEALDGLASGSNDLILMDLKMPGICGIQITQRFVPMRCRCNDKRYKKHCTAAPQEKIKTPKIDSDSEREVPRLVLPSELRNILSLPLVCKKCSLSRVCGRVDSNRVV